MIGCLRTRVRKQPIITINFEFEAVPKFYNLEAWGLFTPSASPQRLARILKTRILQV